LYALRTPNHPQHQPDPPTIPPSRQFPQQSRPAYFGLKNDAETSTYSAARRFDISIIGTASRVLFFTNEEVGEKSGAG
jgi:hypothetical protein